MTNTNAYLITFTILGLYFAAVPLVLMSGRLIMQGDLYRRQAARRGKHYPPSRIIQDLPPIQETMIELIGTSSQSRQLLQRLAKADEPIAFRKLLAGVPAGECSPSALVLMAVAGLICFRRQGVFITELGREVLSRMNGGALPRLEVATDAAETKEADALPESAPGFGTFVEPRLEPGALLCNQREADLSAPLLTAADHRELSAAIVAARKLAAHAGETQSLQEKLAHAVIFPTGQLPPEVITMYSRAELLDLETGEQLNLVLVFPIDANLAHGRVSVFHPLGTAMLGRRVGDRFDWKIPYGMRRFEVRAVHFQPEAALAKAA